MNGQSAPHTPSTPPHPSGGFFASVRQLGIWRTQDRWAGGVAAGIAHRFGVDPLLVRGLFVLVTLFGGIGLVVYGLAWALLPEASDGRIHLEQAVRGHVDVALAGAAVTLIVGLSRPVFWWTSSWWAVPWVVVVAAVIAVVLLSGNRPTQPGPQPPPAYGPPGAAAGPGAPVHPAAAPAPWQPGPAAYAQPGGAAPATRPGPGSPDRPHGAAPAADAATSSRPAYDVPEDTVSHPPTTPTADGPASVEPETTAPLPEQEPTAPGADATTVLPEAGTADPAQDTAVYPDAADTDRQDDATTLAARQDDPTVTARIGEPTEQLPTEPSPERPEPSGYAYQGWDQGTTQSWDRSTGWTGGAGGSGAWGGGSGGGVPGPVPAQQPPVPPRPPVPGPGSRMTSLVLAIALFGAAAVALAHQTGNLDGNAWLVGSGVVLTVLGLGVLVSGVRGRTQGGLGATALVLAILLVPTAAAAAALPGFARIGTSSTTWAGDPTWVPTSPGAAEQGYSLFAGELVVDLTELDLDEDLTVPAHVTFGDLTLIVPDEGAVTIESGVGTGGIEARVDDDWYGPNLTRNNTTGDAGTNGIGLSATLERDGAGPHITIDAQVSVGMIYIEEAS